MTLVLEGAAIAAVVGAVGGGAQLKQEWKNQEEREANQLYFRFFGSQLSDAGREDVTFKGRSIPDNVEPIATTCVRIIETYQNERSKSFLGFKRFNKFSGDTRTLILEELKDWLLTVSKDTLMKVEEVSARLEYCRQIMLRPGIFTGENELSFLQTLAHVCKELEKLRVRMLTETQINAGRLEKVFRTGKELVECTLGIFLYAISNDVARRASSVSSLPSAVSSPPPELDLNSILGSAKADECDQVDWRTEAGKALRSLVTSSHFQALYYGELPPDVQLELYKGGSPDLIGRASGEAGDPLPALLESIRMQWVESGACEGSGLLEPFRSDAHSSTRESYIDLMLQVDRLAFFLHALRPFKELGLQAGDIAMCRLNKQLSHLLQELESALVLLRQAWLGVMRGAKKQLLTVTKRKPTSVENYWLQGLRHIDDTRANQLYQIVIELCAEVRVASSETRAWELQQNAKQGILSIVDTMGSADFAARCSRPLPAGVVQDMKALKVGEPGRVAIEAD